MTLPPKLEKQIRERVIKDAKEGKFLGMRLKQKPKQEPKKPEK